jgi:5-enolpyruvylshikimate-3-phosphate synthase
MYEGGMPQVTNPAAEMLALCRKLKTYESGENGYGALARVVEVDANSAAFFLVLAALKTRAQTQ